MKQFNDKVQRDLDYEKQQADILKAKNMEVQQHILMQIEEKRVKGKGMTKEEFDFNKDLLKEIAVKKRDLV